MSAELENPRRPPRQWMRDCERGAAKSARNPGAVCGALWYHKLSPAQRRAALRREGKSEAEMLENAEPAGTLLAIAIGAVVIFGAAWLLKKPESTSAATTVGPCPAYDQSDIPAFAKVKGYTVVHTELPASAFPPPPSDFRNDPQARAWSRADCGFQKWTGNYWTADDATNAELVAYRQLKAVQGPRTLHHHPVFAFMPGREKT